MTTTNVFNEAGRLAETTSKDESSSVLEALKYAYDAEGNVSSRTDTRAETETTYAYDKLGRLSEFNPPGEGSTSYGYDKAGNRTEAGGTTYEFNALNQLVKASDGTTYGYDKAGRMTAKESEAGKTTYEWDLFDHLAKAKEPGVTASYAYDALERPSERKSGESIQIFHYGDLSDIATYDTNGESETTTSYVAGPRGLLEERSAEATSYPLSDAHGDITAITGPTGSVESRQNYDPWGTQLSGTSLEMGFLGAQERRADPLTGLIQMGARSYSPELGAFPSEDPVFGATGLGIATNRYSYVWDKPLVLFDLDGQFPSFSDITGAAADAAGSAWDATAGNVIEAGADYAGEVGSFWSDRYSDFVKSLKSECDSSFAGRAADDFLNTNKAVPGLVAPTLSGALINRLAGIAASRGTLTAFDWLKNSRNLAQLPSVARAAGLSWLYASLAWEAGVGIGSVARSALAELYC